MNTRKVNFLKPDATNDISGILILCYDNVVYNDHVSALKIFVGHNVKSVVSELREQICKSIS